MKMHVDRYEWQTGSKSIKCGKWYGCLIQSDTKNANVEWSDSNSKCR